jgi:cytidylate kinase
MLTTSPFIVTVGRCFGSGGRELGSLLAKRLNVEFYDKKLLLDAARQSGFLPELIERGDERQPSIFGGVSFSLDMFMSSPFTGPACVTDDTVYQAQSDVIRHLGRTQSCVIVGRTADYVLRDHPCCINLFVHAPERDCIRRIIARGDRTNESDARAMMRKINKLRASYYNFYTDRHWGQASTYDLTLDSSLLPMEQLAEMLASYVNMRLEAAAARGAI